MERGPLALFGAIVAVGVGPALWLGAQLGTADLGPGQRPAPVDEQFPGVDMDFGGSGAGSGELPDDEEPLTTYTYVPVAPPASPEGAPRPEPFTSAPSSLRPVGSVSPSSSRAAPSASAETSPSIPVPPSGSDPLPSVSAEPEPSQSETPASAEPVLEPARDEDGSQPVRVETVQ